MKFKKEFDANGELIKYIEFEEDGVTVEDYYELANRVLIKSNKFGDKKNIKKSKILFNEDCELNCINMNHYCRVTAIKKGSSSLIQPKIKSRIDFNGETNTFSYTIKKSIFDDWVNKLQK